MKKATMRKTKEESGVVDTGICHGSFGNMQIFNRIYMETEEEIFKNAADFWLNDGISKTNSKKINLKQWKTKSNKWKSDIKLLEGMAGIGLVLIEYLSFQNLDWDECLMIS
jgi:lantibiotic modifying enzyme